MGGILLLRNLLPERLVEEPNGVDRPQKGQECKAEVEVLSAQVQLLGPAHLGVGQVHVR